MKKFLLVIFIISLSSGAFGQEDDRRFTVLTSPFLPYMSLIMSIALTETPMFMMDLEGQYKINDIFSVSLAGSFLINNNYPVEDKEHDGSYGVDTSQWNIRPMFIYKPFKKGFYIGLYPNIGWRAYKTKYESYLFTELGLGLNAGFHWIFKNGFTIQAGSGLIYRWSVPERPAKMHIIVYPNGWVTESAFDILVWEIKIGYSF
jgi:hypothetical protein